ncbi:hypothetical protein [Polaromonas sp.]|uniref:hypothetical protein n=1 Tax=Polaromonas sp. TaxID=1869339 RepID=UPI0032630104
MTRRNASPQEAQHIADMLAGLNLEAEGAAVILEALDLALGNSFVYSITSTQPVLAAADAMRETAALFWHPRPTLTPQMRADAAAFGGSLESETTQ